ncbi:MAG: L-threonylcarbamoyladenylate synthase [Bryobacteraceae bacterium]
MVTDLIEVDAEHPAKEALARAGAIIRRGGIVATPTDALYALIADPFNLQAVQRVFEAKGREFTQALPMVVDDHLMAEDLIGEVSKRFLVLARRFWPGPLTMIVRASAKVPLKVTGNTGRLALRQVRSPVVNGLIEWLGQPLICTSANLSGQPTCRTGIEVFGTMDGRLDLVLDGGACVGSGPTTIDITEPWWKVIREGAIPEREIAECLKGV